jgi:hypothetical protein
MKTFKKALVLLIAFLLSVAIPYVGFSFIEWNYNPKDWSIASRVISFIISYALFNLSINELTKDK